MNCARCKKPLGFSKKEPDSTWGFDGKICDDCNNYIRNGLVTYTVDYADGYSKIPSRTQGSLTIQLFDHRNKIFFTTKNPNLNLEINPDTLLEYDIAIMDDKSKAKQILTAGFSNSTKKRYLKIIFKEEERTESLILNIDYSLETVCRNLEPILTEAFKKKSYAIERSEIVSCKKCGAKNNLDNHFCSACGDKLKIEVVGTETNTIQEQRDYVLKKGEKTQYEIDAEEFAKRTAKPDHQFDVKYLGGHKAFPTKKARDAKIRIFIDRIEVDADKLKVAIPFKRMTNIENTDEKKITLKRWFLVGLWAIPWKKNYVYTVIEYDDENDSQGLIFDFGKHLEDKQKIIYERMISVKSNKDKFREFYK